ncbi:MAG: SLC13 family permease [Candidatus Zixiibacteriota bacterium]
MSDLLRHHTDHSGPRLPRQPEVVVLAEAAPRVNWRRIGFLVLGVALFLVIYLMPPFPDAPDPLGEIVSLSPQGQAALALFFLATVWWVFEVVPIGVTGILVGVLQVLLLIRPARDAFGDFFHPAIWFIIGSVVFGLSFTRTGLTKRLAYKVLTLAGERTSMILLSCFLMTAALCHVMAHTAVAASLFPLFMAIYGLYTDETRPTRFGKALFIGVAYVAGAASIVTLLGSARAPLAVGMFREMAAADVTFYQFTWYLAPLGWIMVAALWLFFMIFFRPEQKTIAGLSGRMNSLYAKLGPFSRAETVTITIVGLTIAIMSLGFAIPFLGSFDKSAVVMAGAVLLFVFRVLDLEDLEKVPWNIVLLFGGGMSLGLCLWQTGAAHWVAVNLLRLFDQFPWLVSVLGMALLVLVLTNFIINVAVIALCLPVGVALCPYLGVTAEIVMFAMLVTSGMPFLMLIGAAPNAIAYESRQFSAGQFFKAGLPISVLVMLILAMFVRYIWPAMGMG